MTESPSLLVAWLFGTTSEVLAASLVFVVSLGLGLGAGLGAAFGPRFADVALSRAAEIFGALPAIVTVFVLRAIHPQGGLLELGAVLAIVSGFSASRSLRAEALVLAREDFIVSLRALGIGSLRLVRRHVLAHLLPTALSHAGTSAAGLLALDAAFAFLGLGTTPGSWGSLLAQGAEGAGLGYVLLPAISTLALTALFFRIAEIARRRREGPPLALLPDASPAGKRSARSSAPC